MTRLWLSAAWSAAQRALLGMIEGIRQMVTDWQRSYYSGASHNLLPA